MIVDHVFATATLEPDTQGAQPATGKIQHRPPSQQNVFVVHRNGRRATDLQHACDLAHSGLGVGSMVYHAEAIDVAEVAIVKRQGLGVADTERGVAVVDLAASFCQFNGLVRQVAGPQVRTATAADFDRPKTRSAAEIQHAFVVRSARKNAFVEGAGEAVFDIDLAMLGKKFR